MASDTAAAATAAYFAATADGPFDHQRDAFEAGYEAGRAEERERIIAEARSLSAMCPGCDVFAAFVVDLIQARTQP